MVRGSSYRRAVFWAAAALLLLKGLLPAVAAAAAGARSLPLIEVCTLYGVKILPFGTANPLADAEPGSSHPGHDGSVCVLAALGHGPAPGVMATWVSPALAFVPSPRLERDAGTIDRIRRWMAGLKLEPPQRG